MDEVWFYQYEILIWNESCKEGSDRKEVVSGLVTAKSMVGAIKKLEKYYGDVEDIYHLKAIAYNVFEFEDVNKDEDFDYYIINKKESFE